MGTSTRDTNYFSIIIVVQSFREECEATAVKQDSHSRSGSINRTRAPTPPPPSLGRGFGMDLCPFSVRDEILVEILLIGTNHSKDLLVGD